METDRCGVLYKNICSGTTEIERSIRERIHPGTTDRGFTLCQSGVHRKGSTLLKTRRYSTEPYKVEMVYVYADLLC
jgi:hypothetical protein